LAYLGLGAGLFIGQRRLIYRPNRQGWEQVRSRAAGLGLRPWVDERRYLGFVHADGPTDPKGQILVFHGNAGTVLDRSYYLPDLEGLGYRVVLCEYPGYGAMPGKPCQSGMVEAGIRAVEAALQDLGKAPILIGESLGAAVAAAVAGSGQVEVGGLILITPWDSLANLAQQLYWYFPTRWFILDRFDSMKALSGFSKPVAVVMAELDQVVPARNTLRLYESIGGHKRIWKLPSVGHNSWPCAVDRRWWREVLDFVEHGTQGPTIETGGSPLSGRPQTR
jgi:pimeloyl-ACP methyl ester carboxylesterase